MKAPSFHLVTADSKTRARAGVLETPHGVIQTPAFVTVGTLASVRTLTPDEIHAVGSQVVLANTYHLYLEGRHEVIEKAGGLAKFMGWSGPTMTDSGGFQVFSLGHGRGRKDGEVMYDLNADVDQGGPERPVSQKFKITEGKVIFQSPRDGATLELSPEISINIQEKLGADICFAFDECTDPVWPHSYQKEALERTTRWARRSLAARTRSDQMLFGILQGGDFRDLRDESIRQIAALPFDGFGIGGRVDLSDKESIATVVGWTTENLPDEKPRHLLGFGSPHDMLDIVAAGVDLFDCVLPTREGRNGTLYTKNGKIHIMNAQYRNDFSPLEEGCGCYLCLHFTRSYLYHLFRGGELLAKRLASIHNLFFINSLVAGVRAAVMDGRFSEFRAEFHQRGAYRRGKTGANGVVV